jgi:ferredoxin--NADP+ reductase
MAHLEDFNTDNRFQARVLKTERLTPEETDEVREILLEVQDPQFDCAVHQGFGVLMKTSGEFGNRLHHRLYSVADLPEKQNGRQRIAMLVKRCWYVDDFSGEKYPGIASNYLCDRKPGDTITITGPHDLPFKVPEEKDANLILVGLGTGIAPFRALVKYIYQKVPDWQGKIRLFYGARSGLELLYLNEEDGDLTQYYNRETFEAFKALSPRPHWADPIALDEAIEARAAKIIDMLSLANTRIYVAGYEKVRDMLDKAFSNIMESKIKWHTRKAELKAGGKWAEIIY